MLHKLRSFLTMLGTILGVGSVIAMLAIGEGSKRKAVEQIRQLGATNVIIRSIKPEPENENGNDRQQCRAAAELACSRIRPEVSRLRAVPRHHPHRGPGSAHRDAAQGRRSTDGRRMSNARILGTTPLTA